MLVAGINSSIKQNKVEYIWARGNTNKIVWYKEKHQRYGGSQTAKTKTYYLADW